MIEEFSEILYDGFEDEAYPGFVLNTEQEQRATGYMALKSFGAKFNPPVHKGCRCRIEPVEERAVAWKPATTIDDAIAQLKEKFGIDKISLYEYIKNADKVKDINFVGGEIAKLSNIVKINRHPTIGLFNKVILPGGNIGTYLGEGFDIGKINICLLERSRKPILKIGSFSIGNDVGTLLRHEYGHHIYRNISSKSWENVLSNVAIENEISKYAAASAEEAFAECFAAYTSPLYKDAAEKLPDVIEKFFKDRF